MWRRITAQLLCLVLLLASAASGAHARGDRDAECAAVIVTAHDASAHSIGGAPKVPDEHPLHCLACHWARSFRPRTETGYLDAPTHDVGSRLLVEALPLAAGSIIAQPPLRSPPA